MKIFYILFLTLFIISCSRNTQTFDNNPDSENENRNYDNTSQEQNNIELQTSELIETTEIPVITMFVTANNGLRMRSIPSINGEVQGTHLFGQRLVFDARSKDMVTIDNITDYWYKILFRNEWLFGGYLSEEFPPDADTLIGWWDNIRNPTHIFIFEPNYEFIIGFKNSEAVSWGTWELNDDIITLNMVNIIEEENYVDLNESIENWIIRIIDINNIILIFPNNETRELTRNYDYW